MSGVGYDASTSTMGSANGNLSYEAEVKPIDVASRYQIMHANKYEVLERGYQCSELTIPHLLKRSEVGENDALPTPYQSIGARAVNNLSNKLLLTLFPTSSPFFKLAIAEPVIQEMQQEGADDARNQIEERLISQEEVVQRDMEVNGFRPKFHEGIRHLVVVGNYLLHIPKEGEPVGYSLAHYVVKRSNSGKVLEIILKESLSLEELPAKWKEQIIEACSHKGSTDDINKRVLDIYTRVHFDGKMYKEAKYYESVMLEGSEASYPEDANAWIPLRWTGASSEDYGRGYCEEYLGDLKSLEGLEKAILQASALASKTFGILKRSSTIRPEDIARVENGGVVSGDPDDLTYPEIGKYNDLRVAKEQIERYIQNLSSAFLITQTRNAERVTAEEIRLQASELETALGGAYSLLAKTFQEPVLAREIQRLKKSKALPQIPDKAIDPKIIVGLEGLGRGTDLDKLMRASGAISQIAPSAQFIPRLDMDKLTAFVFNSVGLEPNGVLKSDQEMQQAQAEAQQQAVMQQGMQTMGAMATQATKPLVEGAIENPEQTQQVVDNIQSAVTPDQE
jgi:hypothetical protein